MVPKEASGILLESGQRGMPSDFIHDSDVRDFGS